MITITTEFNLSKEGRKSDLPDRPSDLLSIDPNKCFQLDSMGAFRWIDVFANHSPLDPLAYVEDVLNRRRRFLEKNRSGKLFDLKSCKIEIDSMTFNYRLKDGEWVTG